MFATCQVDAFVVSYFGPYDLPRSQGGSELHYLQDLFHGEGRPDSKCIFPYQIFNKHYHFANN